MSIFSKEELLRFNEKMIERSNFNDKDTKGYNKADYGACITYLDVLSNSQYTDLSKRLTKYCNTQLNISREDMLETYKYLSEVAEKSKRSDGISVRIRGLDSLVAFRFNVNFIEVLKSQPTRTWSKELNCWVVPNGNLIKLLIELKSVGADVDNAMRYAYNNGIR